jgi:hypothetical protein
MSVNFGLVEDRVSDAKAIAWDTCHKIYLLMDNEQVEVMRGYGYDPLITSEEADPYAMFEILKNWYDDSCGLKFIQAVSTETGFESLIEQGAGWEEEDEDDN